MSIYEETLLKLENLCFKNKYTKCYINIMNKSIERNWNRKIKLYKEKHHILPKSIEKNDITIFLTAREHFVCHLLLTKMLKDKTHKKKMILALHRLVHGNKYSVYCKSSKIYEMIKKSHSEVARKRSILYWNNISSEERSKMRSGENNGRFGKEVRESTRNLISHKNKGRFSKEKHPLWKRGHSEETKKKMSIDTLLSGRNSKENNPMYGKIGASNGKKWYHDDLNMIEKYFISGTQPENFKEGRLKRVSAK